MKKIRRFYYKRRKGKAQVKNQTISKKDLVRQSDVERMAREAAKTKGITRALDEAIQHGQRDAKDYGGAFDAIADMADSLQADLSKLADEINTEKWGR